MLRSKCSRQPVLCPQMPVPRALRYGGIKGRAERRISNDVSRLGPGVYFVRSAAGGGRLANTVRKVIVQ